MFGQLTRRIHGLAAATATITLTMQATALNSQTESAQLHDAVQEKLGALYRQSGVPGVSVGIVLANGERLAMAAGLADTAEGSPMEPSSRLMQGSVGKTYVAAVAMQLIYEELLNLDEEVSTYLGDRPWFARLPNHADVTVRHLMTHTSGIIRYEFDDRFIGDLVASPDKTWKPVELLAYLFDTEAPFPAGEGWEYSDTNYIILGMIIESLTGESYYDAMRARLLDPLGLENTVPTNTRRVPQLVQGYAGVDNLFRVPDAVIVNGEFAINPQFEWTGGGVASTTEDLAIWASDLYEGRAFDESMLPVMLEGVPARLGPNAEYGLGVIIRPTPLGISWGHSGFFPGYLTEMAYFPEHGIAVAVQVNSSDFQNIRIPVWRMLIELARTAVERSRSTCS